MGTNESGRIDVKSCDNLYWFYMEANMTKSLPKPSRRGFFLGAAATGVAAAVVVSIPGAPVLEAATQLAKPAPEKGGGYSLTEHVKQYYKTTRI